MRRAAAALMAACVLAGCSADAPQPSATRTTPGAPQFVSLNPCTDAILVEVADPSQVLALSHYSSDPRSGSLSPAVAARYQITGGTVEEVLALEPDIVLAGSFIAPARREALTDFGMRVETFGIASDAEQSFVQIRRIAMLAGNRARGEQLIARIKAALARLDAVRAAGAPAAVLWQPGQIVPGEDTLVSALMRRAGLASHSARLGLSQADHLSLEQVLADPPDILLIAGDARAQAHPVLAQLDKTRIEPFDPALLYCAGPTIIGASARLEQIASGPTGAFAP